MGFYGLNTCRWHVCELQHRIGGSEKLSVNTPASANVQHRIGGLEIKQNNVTTLQELKLWV